MGIAYFFALTFEPLIRIGERRRIRRAWSITALALVAVGLLVGLAALVIPVISAQVALLAHSIPSELEHLTGIGWVRDLTSQLGLGSSLHDLVNTVTGYLADPARLRTIGGGLFWVGSGIVDGAVAAVIVLVLTVYFCAVLPTITNSVFRLVPRSRAAGARRVYDKMTESVSAYVAGQLSVAALTAALTTMMLLILQVPGALLLGVLAFLGALIPIVGTIAAGVVMIVVCLITSPAAGLVAALFYITWHPLEGYVIGPRIIGRAAHVPGVLALIAVTAGALLGGVLGAVVAVPIAAALMVLIRDVVEPRQATR
ncbi:hypothetical protein AS850_16215 [Frondihabitans sp. 762G35]|uniref:AI-2E family transporter n=1 Tax=Frondihabitans sp. 762G35 TaxID=1446794 RepID=UPI000D220175|nr:hypothetical protein AS850_16215 [Frondihabitans sp. 762G35]